MRARLAAALAALLISPFIVLSAAAAAQDTAPAEPPAVPGDPDDPFAGAAFLERAALVAAVLDRNPTLESARAAWEAARQRVPQARSLADPRLTYGLAPLSIGSADVDFGQSLEVSQAIPYPGKRALRGEAAEARAAARRMEWEEVRLELTRMASDLLYDLYLVDRSLEINRQHVRLLEELKETATTRYASGLVPQQVPLQAEVELTHLVHREVTLEAARGVVVASLNGLLHRPPARPLPPPAPLADDDLPVQELAERVIAAWSAPAVEYPGQARPGTGGASPPSAERGEVERLAESALAARPELRAAAAEVRAREIERELAGMERLPDFGVMGTYSSMWRMTEHQWMVGVSVNLPVWRERIRAAEAEADAELQAARARRRALADEVRTQVVQAADRLAEMARVVDLYESRLLPAARDQLRAARSGFETGQVSFLNVVDAEKNLRSVELGYEEALTDRHRRRADLERALGIEPAAPVSLPAASGPVPLPDAVGTVTETPGSGRLRGPGLASQDPALRDTGLRPALGAGRTRNRQAPIYHFRESSCGAQICGSGSAGRGLPGRTPPFETPAFGRPPGLVGGWSSRSPTSAEGRRLEVRGPEHETASPGTPPTPLDLVSPPVPTTDPTTEPAEAGGAR